MATPPPGHHLVYGSLLDCLNGEELPDTDDERARQRLARLLMDEKGYAREDLEPRLFIETLINKQYVRSTIDLTVSLDGRRVMVVRYGPGSLVTRERSAVAAARLIDSGHQLPLAVVTNGRDAELLDTATGAVLASELDKALPSRARLAELLAGRGLAPPPDQDRRQREERILNAFDLQVCCSGSTCPPPETTI